MFRFIHTCQPIKYSYWSPPQYCIYIKIDWNIKAPVCCHERLNKLFFSIYSSNSSLVLVSIFTGDSNWSDRIFFYHPGTIWVDSGQPGKLQKEGHCWVWVIHLSWTERSLSGFIVFNILGPPSHRPPAYLISGTICLLWATLLPLHATVYFPPDTPVFVTLSCLLPLTNCVITIMGDSILLTWSCYSWNKSLFKS